MPVPFTPNISDDPSVDTWVLDPFQNVSASVNADDNSRCEQGLRPRLQRFTNFNSQVYTADPEKLKRFRRSLKQECIPVGCVPVAR